MNKDEALQTLGLGSSAGDRDINKRFRELSKEKHPDKGGDEDEYKKISAAYEYLKNPPPEPQVHRNGVNQGPGGFWPFGGQPVGFRRVRVNISQPPPPITVSINLTFKEAVLGCTKKIKINRKVMCDGCYGDGEGTIHDLCETCNGKGIVLMQGGSTGGGVYTYAQTCQTCQGGGRQTIKCDACNGTGSVEKKSELEVKFQGGLTNGNVVRLQGAGHYHKMMGTHMAGLVHINVSVETIPNMRLHGRDVISTIDVSLLEALKGCAKKMKTIDGESEVKIQPGTKHKDQIRLKGFGVEHKGDHVFNVNLQYPKDTTQLIDLLQKE